MRLLLLACWGNNDGPELRTRLPEVARATLDGLRFAVVHETGPAQGREARCAAAYPDVDVLIFGHSHIPWDARALTCVVAGPMTAAGVPGRSLGVERTPHDATQRALRCGPWPDPDGPA